MTLVLRRGELLKQDGKGTWLRCWIKMYSDRAVDHVQSKLFDTASVQAVHKTDATNHQFVVDTTNGSHLVFQARSEQDCDEWVRCISDAKRLNLASNGRLLFQQANGVSPRSSLATSPAFIRVEESESSDDDDDNGTLTAPSPVNSPVRSPIRPSITRENASSFTVVHGYINLPDGSRMIVTLPYNATILHTSPVSASKQAILHKLKRKIESNGTSPSELEGMPHHLLTQDSGFFVLVIPDAVRGTFIIVEVVAYLDGRGDIWLRNESKRVKHYLDMRFDAGSSVVSMEVRCINLMPPPPLQVSIVSTVNKVSDLSQREYTAYKIQVEFNDLRWTVDRRYKQFFNLHEALSSSDYELKMYFPAMPPRRAITPKKGSFVAKRQQRLEEYLQDLVALPSMAEDVRVMEFLGVVSMARNVDPEDTRSVLHVSVIHTCLEYGDIVLFKTRFGTSKVQRKLTGARYDHVAIVVPGSAPGQLAILESTGEGIQVYPLKTRLLAYGREVTNAIVARRVLAQRTAETMAKLQQFVLDVNGNKYSIFGILNRSKVDDKEKTSNYFCSELVAAALQHLGWIDSTVPPSYFWPGSFVDGGELETKHLLPSVSFGPELSIDCKIMEVGKAI
ncbi:hypothetical protein LEN26_017170 [Aphanomyces euteiches]|nr:hypothetical protein LEN26_017170 [Aphanomyces euteiches]KAH9114158.1 hypothetical protein AeMF1_011734 [Aphanomyces euteiches]